MGYSTRNNGLIKTYQPDNTDKKYYINSDNYPNYSLLDIIKLAKEKWGEDISLDNIHISSEYIQTDCLNYDAYDPFDYTNFIVIEYTGS